MNGRGDLVQIDLTRGKISKEPIPPELNRKFLGGEGVNAWLLWEHFLKADPGIDPMSPDNVLIFGVGPLAATGLGAGSKGKFAYKSPAYNLYGDTSVGGGFGSQLRWAGHDHLVITGKAKHPVYIWINNDTVEIRDARHIWGKDVPATDALIRADVHDEEAEVACIGQAGENLVRFASIMVGGHRAGGRGGGGCVFGAKNLKAIAARGTKGLPVHDAPGLLDAVREFRRYKERDPGSSFYKRYGTLANIRDLHAVGFLAYRNHQGRLVPEAQIDLTDHNWFANNIGVRAEACSAGCAYACGGWYHLKGNESEGARRHAGEWGPKPEFGSVNPFANGCDIPDLPEVSHLNKLCNDYGMDVMEAAMGIAFVMELWERGIVNRQDTLKWTGEALSLEWGNQQAVEKLLGDIALRRNELGDMLSGGVYRAALRMEDTKNVPALKYALYGKGSATHEAQGRLPSSGLYMAVATVGAHHTKGMGISAVVSEKYLGTPDGGRPDGSMWQGEPTKGQAAACASKGAGHALSEYFTAIINSLGVCLFLGAHRTLREMPPEVFSTALRAVTGEEITSAEMVTAGERTVNLQKAFNSRLGLRRSDDAVCERWMNDPLQEGLAKGARLVDLIELLKDGYYRYHGWDEKTSLQTREKLEQLGMSDVADILAVEGALADGVR